MTKQKKIEELLERIKTLESNLDYYKDLMSKTVQVLRSVYDTSYQGYRAPDINSEDVPVVVQKLKDQVRHEGESTGQEINLLLQENNKLWYLIRAITKDETLKGEKGGEVSNHQELDRMAHTPFRKPNF